VLSAEEMPDDDADLAAIDVDFPLADDTSGACPVRVAELLRYLADEAPGGERLAEADLAFLRTAQVAERRYWIWRFHEPDGGGAAYATVSVNERDQTTVGYAADYCDLTPEQFILGDYHQVF
jgi:hypothetical protein